MSERERATLLLQAWVPLKPPSVNSLYQIIYPLRKVELKPEIRLFKTKFKEFLPPTRPLLPKPLLVELTLHDTWYTKTNTIRKYDLSNLEKCVLDALSEYLGLDDSYIFEKWTRKQHPTEKLGIEVKVWQQT
jgi:Holliday junction resolvase RusA-like endonuclease